MSRSPLRQLSAVALIALFHVAMFGDVVQQLCTSGLGMPQGTMAMAMPEHAAHMAGMDHGAMPADQADHQGQEDAPTHDHGTCNLCCSLGQSDVSRFETVAFQYGAVLRPAAPAAPVELALSPTAYLFPLPNPPPIA